VDHNQFKEEMAHIDNLMTLWTNSTSQRPEIENDMRQMGFTVRVDAAEDDEPILIVSKQKRVGT
jgi:hypothetical protein